jgi:hypothetical protein
MAKAMGPLAGILSSRTVPPITLNAATLRSNLYAVRRNFSTTQL